MAISDIIKKTDIPDWRNRGFDDNLSRVKEENPKPADYIGGANFDVLLDEMTINRMFQLKNLPKNPQGNNIGKMFWDITLGQFKVYNGTTWKVVTLT